MRILIVDDDELSRELLTLLLEGEGYAVEAVESGDAAMAALARRTGMEVDAVLSDMQMPGLTGAALARQMREVTRGAIRLMAMSGSQPAVAELEGFDGFLLKPFSMNELEAALGRMEPVAGVLDLAAAGERETKVEGTGGEEDAGEEGVLDSRTFEELGEMMRPAQMAELYGMCLRDAAVHVAAMQQIQAGQDDGAFQRHAHAMKGSFGMLGARQLQSMASAMEVCGPEGANNDLATLQRFASGMSTLRRILIARGLQVESSVGEERGT